MTSTFTRCTRKSIVGTTLLLVIAGASVSCSGERDAARSSRWSPGKSQFLNELKKQQYPETEAPDTDPVFRWDFSKKHAHTYAYEQEVRNRTNMGDPGNMEQSMSAKGKVVIKSLGDGTADLVLKGMKMRMEMDPGGGGKRTDMEQEMPPVVMQGMKEDGSGPPAGGADALLKLLFPLPSKPLKVGESVDVPTQMPFNAMGSVLQVKGRSRITLTRYVKIGRTTCAQLDVDIDISGLKVPSELKGEYRCSTKGASVFYFDLANRRFISGTTALLMQFSIDAPMPKVNIPGEDTPDMPESVAMSMMSDNLMRVSLE